MENLDLIQLAHFMNVFNSLAQRLPEAKRGAITIHFSTLVEEIVEAQRGEAADVRKGWGAQ